MPEGRPSAIVTDGLWRKSLSAIRSLGRGGFHVTVMGSSIFTTGFWSRYARKQVICPTASENAEEFGEALIRELETRSPSDRPVLLPMEDPSLLWVSRHRDRLSSLARFLIPETDALEIAENKAATLEAAEKLGLPCPRTWRPESPEELFEQAKNLKPGEFVAKPCSGTGSSGVLYGESLSLEKWREHWRRFGKLILQERIPPEGRGQGVSALFDAQGECVAAFAHERLHQYPNSGGPSTDRVSIHAPELVQWSIAFLKSLRWRGVAMVEWKADPRDGKPKLMEVNPRFWGSLELAVRAGVDFPTLYARAAMAGATGTAEGQPLEPVPEYPAGVRCRWLIPGDLLRYLSASKGKREPLKEFLKGLPALAEEWDPKDWQGTVASVICAGALAFNPRYWKYVLRG